MNINIKMYGIMSVFIILCVASFFMGYNNGLDNGRVKQCNDMGQELVLLKNIGEKDRVVCMHADKIPQLNGDMNNFIIDFNNGGQ